MAELLEATSDEIRDIIGLPESVIKLGPLFSVIETGTVLNIGLTADPFITLDSTVDEVDIKKVLDMTTHKIKGVVDPTALQDAATKNYVDTQIATVGGPEFVDSIFRITGSADPSKKIAFEVDGLTTATVRTITPPDANITLVNTATGLIVDVNIGSHVSSKITITAKGQLNPNIVYNDQTNVFGDFNQDFKNDRLRIFNPADDKAYTFSAAAITSDVNINLPLLTVSDTILMANFAATILSKTINLTNNTVTDTSAALGDLIKHNATKYVRFPRGTALQQIRVNAGNTDLEFFTPTSGLGTIRLIQLEGLSIATDREGLNFIDSGQINFNVTDDAGNNRADVAGTIVTNSILDTDIGTHLSTKISITTKAQLNSAIVYTDQTNTFGAFAQIFPDDQLQILNTAGDFKYIFSTAAIITDRVVIFPLLTGNDSFVFENHPQTLASKTLITPTIADFTNATHDHSDAAGAGQLTNTALVSGVFAAITGLGLQSQILNMNTQKISNVVDPTLAQDAATKNYVDSIAISGVKWKDSARVGTTANITLSGEQTIDGVLTSTDRVLVKNQSTLADNGVYVSAAGAWVRSTDTDTSVEILQMAIFVEEGTENLDQGFVLTTNAPITIGVTDLVYTQFTGLGQIIAGAGLTKNGNTLDVGGTTDRISVSADAVDIASTYVGQTSITTLGTITTGVWEGSVISDTFLSDTWNADKDADGNDLNDLSNILFRNSTGVPLATDRSIHYNDAEGMIFNALTGDFIQLEINGVAEYKFDSVFLDMKGNEITNLGTGIVATIGVIRMAITKQIAWRDFANANDHSIGFNGSDDFDIIFSGTSEYLFSKTQLNVKNNDIIMGTGKLQFQTNMFISKDGDDMALDVEAGARYIFRIGTVGEMSLDVAELNLQNNNISLVKLLEINNPADTFQYIITGSAITLDRIATLPLLLANDDFVFANHIATLAGKTLTTPTIASFTNATHNHENAAGGGTLGAAALPSTIVFNNQANTYSGGGKQDFGNADIRVGTGKVEFLTNMFIQRDADDMALNVEGFAQFIFKEGGTARLLVDSAGIELQTGTIRNVSTLEINNPLNTFQYIITGSAITLDRILNLPLTTGTDTLAVLGLGQTFTGANIFNLGLVINEGGTDSDTRIEGLTDPNLLFVDASTDRIGIGTNTPDNPLEIAGALGGLGIHLDSSTGTAVLLDRGGTTNAMYTQFQTAGVDDWRTGVSNQAGFNSDYSIIKGASNTDVKLIVKTDGNVGIGVTVPTEKLEIGGNLKISSGGFVELTEIGSPSNPVANDARLFAKDVGGLTKPFWRDSAGSEFDLSISPIGLHDQWIDAGAFVEITSAAPATRIIGTGDNRKGIAFVEFVNGANEFAVVKFKFPRNYNNGTITVVINWTSQVEGAGNVIWGVAAVATADGDDLAAAATNFGTEITVTDTQTTINFDQESPRTAAITLANTPADADTIYIRIQRRGADGGDTFTQPVQMLGIYAELTTDAAVSA